jgi:hypothetical protein
VPWGFLFLLLLATDNICKQMRGASRRITSDYTVQCGAWLLLARPSSREATSDKLNHGVGLWRNRVWSKVANNVLMYHSLKVQAQTLSLLGVIDLGNGCLIYLP